MAGTRQIEDVLHFRNDISPFLVHLTKPRNEENRTIPAAEVLKEIRCSKEIRSSGKEIAASYYGIDQFTTTDADKARFYSAACFTETPLAEVHTMLEISNRKVDLAPYGIVFLKENLRAMGVSPIWYINNWNGDMDDAVQALASLVSTSPSEAEKILPLVGAFGAKILFPSVRQKQLGAGNTTDFYWEREWRMPHVKCPMSFDWDDVFIGLCPDSEISSFEKAFPEIKFIDPQRSTKWYASKLIEARQRVDLKYSVV